MNAGKPPSRDWRAHPPAQSVYAREWRGGPGEAKSWFSRKTKVRSLFLLVAIVAGLIVILLAPVADRVPAMQIVTFGIGAYGGRATPTGNMPVNPFGENDARAFLALADEFPDQFLPVRQEDNALNGAQLLSFLEQESQSPEVMGRNLVVFCTLHALVQPSGTIELFAIDANPDSPSSSGGAMVPLEDVLERLRRSTARRVLLALDASRLDGYWRAGILVNDVAAQLAAEWRTDGPDSAISTSGSTPVSILLAAPQGQKSWPDGEQSAFASALIEGLSGAADGWGEGSSSGPRDRRVSLRELTRYVQGRVDEHAAKTFGARQTVQLVGDTSDAPLAIVAEPRKEPAKAVAKSKVTDNKGADAGKPTTESAPSSSTPKDSGQTSATAPKAAAPPAIKWETRFEEIRVSRETLVDSGRASILRRRMPFAWRSWDAQLELVESLVRGGLPDLAPSIVRQADLLEKSLLANQESVATGDAADRDAARLSLGFGARSKPPTRDALAAADKYLQSLTAPSPTAGGSPTPAPVPPAEAVPDSWTIQTWIRQQLTGDASARGKTDLRKIVARLDEMGSLPPTVEMVLMRNIILAEGDGTQFTAGNALTRLLSLRDRVRRLAIEQTPALPLLREDLEIALRALTGAERWMLIAGGARPETAQWLDQAERTIAACELTGRGYVDTLAVWTDLLLDLPSYAMWVAARATDDPRRNFTPASLRPVGNQIAAAEQSGQWDVSAIVSAWPDRPARWTDLERRLITLFIDGQRLKRLLLVANSDPSSRESLAVLMREINLHRRDFQEEVTRTLPRLGTGDKPTPLSRLEAERLLKYAWLPAGDRKSLDALSRMTPQGDPLQDRDVAADAVSQGFWAIATLGLLSRNADDTVGVWKEWDRLAELSEKTTSATSETEQLALRKRRADLGRSVRMSWRSLQDRAGMSRSNVSAAEWGLIAATLDPTLLPQVDPDQQLLAEESRQFIDWLTVFASDWRQRHWNARFASGGQIPSSSMWEQAGAILPLNVQIEPQWNEIAAPKFDVARRGQLALAATNTGDQGTRVLLTGRAVRLVEAPGQSLANQSVARPLPNTGQGTLELKLDNDVVTSQDLLVILGDEDGFPYDFRRVTLNPPFDPSDWRIELVESKSESPLQTSTLSKPKGIKVFLPPNGAASLKANLIRPVRDQTSSAKIAVYRLGDGSRSAIVENVELKLEAGKDRTPIVMDVPAPPSPPSPMDSKDKAPPPGPIADLARGWLFEITPEGQSPIEYVVRPTYWSATRFVNPPEPELRDDRFVLVVKRLMETPDDTLIPAKIPIELRLPPSLQGVVKDFTLGGPLGAGQQMTLSFTLPSDWRERARQNNWEVALNVAGLPHAFRWRLDPTGTLTPIGGQPPKVNVRLVLPTEPKAPPRLAPVLRRGQEPLHLVFEVDAAALDRTEGGGDWTLSYTVVRETDEGVEATPLQHSWQLYSSVEQHVFLDGIQRGVWKLTTAANDYETVEPEAEIRGLAGRFQANATLTRADDPQRPAATATLRFSVDDDAPPELTVKGLTTDARLITQDLSFRIEAGDPESGIERILYGFDANADKMLQPEEILESRSLVGFDNPSVTWPVVIARSKLPKIEKDEETRQLLVQAFNSGGIAANRALPVTLKKPVVVLPAKATKGSLVVNLQVSRGAKASIQIAGPDARLQQSSGESVTFSDLTPGQYQITVSVNYAVIGRKEKGEAKVDVKVGETTTANVPLSEAK